MNIGVAYFDSEAIRQRNTETEAGIYFDILDPTIGGAGEEDAPSTGTVEGEGLDSGLSGVDGVGGRDTAGSRVAG